MQRYKFLFEKKSLELIKINAYSRDAGVVIYLKCSDEQYQNHQKFTLTEDEFLSFLGDQNHHLYEALDENGIMELIEMNSAWLNVELKAAFKEYMYINCDFKENEQISSFLDSLKKELEQTPPNWGEIAA